ncbi:tonB-system energizer ExbB [Pseudomonas sp. HK3]
MSVKKISSLLVLFLCVISMDAFSENSSGELSIDALLNQADWVVKTVMGALMFASVVCWSILFVKQVELTSAIKNSKALNMSIVNAQQLGESVMMNKNTPEYELLSAAKQEYDWTVHHTGDDEKAKSRIIERLNTITVALVSERLTGTGILASVGSVAPFIGLFGTVWGIMNSFIGIAENETTNLAVVAPGIAEALLATAFGLVAAIPAVIFYNYFSRKVTGYQKHLDVISSNILLIASRQLELHLKQYHGSLLDDNAAIAAVKK